MFDKGFKPDDIGHFRGAMLTLLPDDPVLHNHGDDTILYRYPKVQYKLCQRKACIIGMDEGADILERELHLGDELTLKLGRRICTFKVTDKTTTYFNPDRQDPDGFDYRISGWLPLNQDNHMVYEQMDSMYERISLLDSILISNILRLHRGLEHNIDYQCKAYIKDIIRSGSIKYKGVEMLTLDVTIHTNTCLPENFGIGKGSARGHGTIMTIKQQTDDTPDNV